MSDQSQIGFEQLGIGALLKRYRLVVPPNQRDYAWEDDQVSTLFGDLALAISQDEANYFLGTIVTVPIEHGVLEVIDGQQRLATVSLALAAMKHRVAAPIPNLARALDDFLSNMDSNTLELTSKMRLNTADNDTFANLIATGKVGAGFVSARQSHKNLQSAFSTSTGKWRDIAKPYDKANEVDVFKRWMNYLEFKAKVILLQVPNTVNAFKMFETLNDRGLKTSQADLVKNYVLGESGDALKLAQEKWGYVKGSLEAIGEEDITVNFLRQSLICQHGYLRESEVYERVRLNVRGKASAQDFLSEVEVQARDYAALFNYGAPKWSGYPLSARRSLEVLNFLDIAPFRPLLLAISRRFSPDEATKALEGMVSLAVRLIIASSTRSGSVEQPLAKCANMVFKNEVTSSKDIFSALSSIIPSDEQFKESFATASVSKPQLARYYLRSIEAAHKRDAEPWFVPNEDALSITLEHILPINPEGNWPQFTDDEVKVYSKRIGNLALMQASTNSNLRSDAFSVKLTAFKKSPYATTSVVGEVTEWTSKQIVARQRMLADLSVQAWPLPS